MKLGSSMGLFLLVRRDLWPRMKCHMVSETLLSRPWSGFFILVGKNMVTLESWSIQGRSRRGGGVASGGVGWDGLWSDRSDSLTVIMSPEDGSWTVYVSPSRVGTVITVVFVAGKVGLVLLIHTD